MMKQYVPANWPHQANPSNKWRAGISKLCANKPYEIEYPNAGKLLNTCNKGCPIGDRVKIYPVRFDE